MLSWAPTAHMELSGENLISEMASFLSFLTTTTAKFASSTVKEPLVKPMASFEASEV